MRASLITVAILLAGAASASPGRFEDQLLLRRDGPWLHPPPSVIAARTAPATILLFRPGGEFIEHHCWVIDGPGHVLTISPGDPHVVVVGQWRADGAGISVTRQRVMRTVSFIGDVDPLCSEPPLSFVVDHQSVKGSAGAAKRGWYRPARLDARRLEAFADEARNSPHACASSPSGATPPAASSETRGPSIDHGPGGHASISSSPERSGRAADADTYQ